MKSLLAWRSAVLPSTLPVLMLSAAYNDSVPWRQYSNPCRSARPGDSGNTGSKRSNAWIAVFSSTQNTAACCGGFMYSPMISAAFCSKSGSLLALVYVLWSETYGWPFNDTLLVQDELAGEVTICKPCVVTPDSRAHLRPGLPCSEK
jgi:hypothetical protein